MSNKLKVIGLALIAICAFGAISATAAQAAPNWTVEGKEFTGEAEVSSEVTTGEIASGKHYVLTVTGLLRITCTKLAVDKGFIFSIFKDKSESLTFFGCSVQNKEGVAQAGCTAADSERAIAGEIHTLPTTTELITKGGVVYDIFTPKSPTRFVTIKVAAAEGKSCALSGSYETNGTVALKPETGTNAVVLNGESSQAIQEAAGASLTFGTRTAFLDGKAGLSLASGKKWGINP